MADITVPVPLPGRTFGQLIKNFSLTDTHFSLPDPFANPDEPKASPRVSAKIRALVGRLVSESAKCGMRVLLITQRADADILDGASRAQMGQRFTFGVDNPDAVRMLHPAVTPETAERVQSFNPGRCLVYQDRIESTAQIDLLTYSEYRSALEEVKA